MTYCSSSCLYTYCSKKCVLSIIDILKQNYAVLGDVAFDGSGCFVCLGSFPFFELFIFETNQTANAK